MDWALLYALTDQEIYIINISQRPQSHKYGLNQLKLIPGSHTQTGEQKQNRHTSFTFKAISQHLHLSFSLSLKRKTISHPKSARRWENEKREEKKYNVPPSLRRGKSFRRGSLQTRRGNEIICADLRSCVFVINYGWWRGNTSESVGEDGEPTKCVIITTNRQTDKQNRRTPCVMLPKVKSCDNNQLQRWKRCRHRETDKQTQRWTDRQSKEKSVAQSVRQSVLYK